MAAGSADQRGVHRVAEFGRPEVAAQSGVDFPFALEGIRPAPCVLNVRLHALGFDPVGRPDYIIQFNDLFRSFIDVTDAVLGVGGDESGRVHQ